MEDVNLPQIVHTCFSFFLLFCWSNFKCPRYSLTVGNHTRHLPQPRNPSWIVLWWNTIFDFRTTTPQISQSPLLWASSSWATSSLYDMKVSLHLEHFFGCSNVVWPRWKCRVSEWMLEQARLHTRHVGFWLRFSSQWKFSTWFRRFEMGMVQILQTSLTGAGFAGKWNLAMWATKRSLCRNLWLQWAQFKNGKRWGGGVGGFSGVFSTFPFNDIDSELWNGEGKVQSWKKCIRS